MARALDDALAAAALALHSPATSARVVDVEAGLGALTLLVARRAARVDAVDASPAIVKALRARVAVAKLGNVEVRVGDPAALPFPEHSFDAAYLLGLAVPAREPALVELRRVLKPGTHAVAAGADRDALVEEMLLAGFDDVVASAAPAAKAWLAIGVA
jgi:ubiquinone/menaquinone biosynthesis C-methylase UbiE